MGKGPIRVGVIGAGSMGRNHIRVYGLVRDVELVGAADPDAAARERVSAEDGIRAWADHRDLLRHVDAVTVAVPTKMHRAVTLECIEAGLHVLVEKPIAATSAEGREMAAAADARGVVLLVGHIERFNPAVVELGRLLANDPPVAIDARRLSPVTPRVTDIDVVFDLMIHDIDIALSVAGTPMRELNAIGRPSPPAPLDHVVVQGRTTGGVIVRLAASKITQETVRQLDVTTERTFIRVNYMTRDITVHQRASVSPSRADGESYTEEASIARPHVTTIEPLRMEIEHFLDCIRTNGRPLTSAASAIAALEVAERVQRLAAEEAARR